MEENKKLIECKDASNCENFKSKTCPYKIHYCLNKKKNDCSNPSCSFEHDCYHGKNCFLIKSNECKLNHSKKCTNPICQYGKTCKFSHDDDELYCNNGKDCLHSFHCCWPHKINFYLSCFEKFAKERQKEKGECNIFSNPVASTYKCFGFKCCFDHSSPKFKRIYEIANSSHKSLMDLRGFEKDYLSSDLKTDGVEKKIFCTHRLKCKRIECTFAHTIETYIQKICFFTICLMKKEIEAYLLPKLKDKEKVRCFLHGASKTQDFFSEVNEETLKNEIKRTKALINSILQKDSSSSSSKKIDVGYVGSIAEFPTWETVTQKNTKKSETKPKNSPNKISEPSDKYPTSDSEEEINDIDDDDDEKSESFIGNDRHHSNSEEAEEVQSQKSKNSAKIQNISTISAKPILNATQTQQAKNVIPQKKPEKTTAEKGSDFDYEKKLADLREKYMELDEENEALKKENSELKKKYEDCMELLKKKENYISKLEKKQTKN